MHKCLLLLELIHPPASLSGMTGQRDGAGWLALLVLRHLLHPGLRAAGVRCMDHRARVAFARTHAKLHKLVAQHRTVVLGVLTQTLFRKLLEPPDLLQ